MIDEIRDDAGALLAVVARTGFATPGDHFLTDPACIVQVGVARHPAGWSVPAHAHKPQRRETVGTGEVLLVLAGFMHVEVGTGCADAIRTPVLTRFGRRLGAGDLIVVMPGTPHALEALTELKLLEIKNGPYNGRDADKHLLRSTHEAETQPEEPGPRPLLGTGT